MLKNILVFVIVLLSGGGLLLLGMYYYTQSVEVTAVRILAPTDDPLRRIKVYEKFMPIQLLRLSDPIRLTRVSIPLYTGTTHELLTVSLLRNGILLHRWRLDPNQWEENSVTEVHLDLPSPLLIDGDLEVVFAAPTIAIEHREEANQVFFEPADTYYPEGHFRIAGEDKRGDIGLSLIAKKDRWELETRDWFKDPVRYTARASLWLLFVPLLFSIPALIKRRGMHEQ